MASTSQPSCSWLNPPSTGTWQASGDRAVVEARKPFRNPRILQTIENASLGLRFISHYLRHYKRRHKLFINPLNPLKAHPYYGVPCGGIGCGSIGRDFRGGFCKFSLRPGIVEQKVKFVPADQFIVTIRKGDTTVYQRVLCAKRPRRCWGPLSAWAFGVAAKQITYDGLYPRSWTTYDISEQHVRLTCVQISPVLPNNYKDTAMPATVFSWHVENYGDEMLHVSITFTFGDGTGVNDSPNLQAIYANVTRSSSANTQVANVETSNSIAQPLLPSISFSNAQDRKHRQRPQCRSALHDAQEGGVAIQVCTPRSTSHLDIQGVHLAHYIAGMPCTYTVSTVEKEGQRITRCLRFDPRGSGRAIWNDLRDNGRVALAYDGVSPESSSRLGVALSCSTCKLMPGKSDTIDMCLTWDMPNVMFGGRQRLYKRRYTRFFGGDGEAAHVMSIYALVNFKRWHAEVDDWQNPVLNHQSLPSWYKSALFNELYFLTDGGSSWLEYDPEWRLSEGDMSDYAAEVFEECGRFVYLESFEYRMLNTYDVHFYSSFALVHNWPLLEHSIHADFCDQVFRSDATRVRFFANGRSGVVKLANRVPHDLGNPYEEPFVHTNAYEMADTADWRDLCLKWVAATHRNAVHVVDKAHAIDFVTHCWPAVLQIMQQCMLHFDRAQTGMITHNGTTGEQTYDAWRLKGCAAYTGSLWLAALQSVVTMAKTYTGDVKTEQKYAEILGRAKSIFGERLWTGEYYRLDEHTDTIMADQLCGIWYHQACQPSNEKEDKVEPLLPPHNVSRALNTIFDSNVMAVCNGRMGAVNGMKCAHKSSPCKVDTTSPQSEEMWAGTTYSLAAFMLHQNKIVPAFRTAAGVYECVWRRCGLQYQSPEAVYVQRPFYRAIGYMRPLAIWAMQHALVNAHNFPQLSAQLFPHGNDSLAAHSSSSLPPPPVAHNSSSSSTVNGGVPRPPPPKPPAQGSSPSSTQSSSSTANSTKPPPVHSENNGGTAHLPSIVEDRGERRGKTEKNHFVDKDLTDYWMVQGAM